ncbi:MAG: hydrogenase formation protein HypD [Planctomycetota bacterium]|nr:hydrogenase formation protein HypD [Planctomycetota bacterium]
MSCKKIHEICDGLFSRRQRVQIMEVCGTHTMSIARSGLRSLLPEGLNLISGPGCPVCVTEQSYVDKAVALADRSSEFVIATYGDMVRVPGSRSSLAEARAGGADVRVVTSADRALELARQLGQKQVVFLAVGFETTAPGTALAVQEAKRQGVNNFSALTAHKLILPAMDALLAADDVRIDGFLCPGHVSVILGYGAYDGLSRRYGRPCVVAGFDPLQIIAALEAILQQLADGRSEAVSVYPAVARDGNPTALKLLEDVFVEADTSWRSLGVIPNSGLVLRQEFAEFDAAKRFELPATESHESPGCRCGDVICGRCTPFECELFSSGRCTPRAPVGPCMVSSEGACAAAYKYEKR